MPGDGGAWPETVDLSGEWNFALDPEDVGVEAAWYERALEGSISLPGTTDEAGVGDPATGRETHHLTRTRRYEGAAWYQRTVEVPERWLDKHVALVLERSRTTTVWVDDARVGTRRSLSTAHEYDLTDHVDAGTCRLTVRVDNDSPPVTFGGVQNSHQATAETQTNWNGILGDLSLRATDPMWIADARLRFGDAGGTATLELDVENRTGDRLAGHVRTWVSGPEETDPDPTPAEPDAAAGSADVAIDPGERSVTVDLDLDAGAHRWDEFDPGVDDLAVELRGTAAGEEVVHGTRVPLGRCLFERDGTQFSVNGRTTVLRGETNCCVFPETGYAPMDVDAWRDVFRTAKRYGLNHYRFHSWCPPEAAFDAADDLGVYLQPELPFWGTVFESDAARAFYYDEAEAILDAYADHPSFVLFSLGNELSGSREAARELVAHCREYDGDRNLYAAGANSFHGEPEQLEGDDVWVTMMTGGEYRPGALDAAERAAGLVRGSFSPHTLGHINSQPPATDRDYREAIADVDVPVVGHEIGQFQTYPDYDPIEKYDGVLEPRNLALFRDHLAAHGLAGRDGEFQAASGALAAACYREDVEAALRTPGFGGFQLLGLQDFPGQGTAPVGLVDAFMDDKGIVAVDEWRESCAPVVALARLPSRVWTAGETVPISVQVANYGPDAIPEATPYWTLSTADGERVAAGRAAPTTVPQGDLATVADAEVPTGDVDPPAHLVLEVGLEETDVSNTYDVWAYPDDRTAPTDDLVVRQTYDEETVARLRDGDTVLLLAPEGGWDGSLEGAFQPDYWSYGSDWKRGQAPPGTMGLLVDADHPALAAFPTDTHSDWQWWHVAKGSNPVVLDDLGGGYEPIVRAIDNPERNQNLGVVFEGTVGDGAFLACAADLRAIDDPAAEQLLVSLCEYVGSDAFDPERGFTERQMAKFFQ